MTKDDERSKSGNNDFSDIEFLRKPKSKFNFEKFFEEKKYIISVLLVGLILLGFGAIYLKKDSFFESDKIEVLEETTEPKVVDKQIVVEIAGSVEKPGVYKLDSKARVDDLLNVSGGLSVDADRGLVEKLINRAAILSDGQKIYIPSINKQSNTESANNADGYQNISSTTLGANTGLININTATLTELDTLPGIGPVYGQNIIEHRPYSSVEELSSKSVLKKSVYEKIKDKVSVY
jgi:competence protein ComEA